MTKENNSVYVKTLNKLKILSHCIGTDSFVQLLLWLDLCNTIYLWLNCDDYYYLLFTCSWLCLFQGQ